MTPSAIVRMDDLAAVNALRYPSHLRDQKGFLFFGGFLR